jgi:hypothetical protein
MVSNIETKVLKQLHALPEDLQRQVLEYVRSLRVAAPRGVAGNELLPFAGTIPQDDLAMMRQAIGEACERVDANEW